MLTVKDNYKIYEKIESKLIYGSKLLVPNPFISIIIPTYKRYELLKYSIESAINQSNSEVEYEVIVIDNEPSEIEIDSERIVKTFSDNKILYYRNEKNIGMFGNWNRGIELARGEWVAFLHDDDLLDKDYIHRVFNLIINNKIKNIGGLVSPMRTILNDSSRSSMANKKHGSFRTFIKKFTKNKLTRLRPIDSQFLGNIYGPPTCGAIFKKQNLIELGGFDERHYPSSDWYFMYNFSKNYKLYLTNYFFGYYRIFDNESLNSTTLNKFLLQAIDFRKYLASTTLIGNILDRAFGNERYFQTLSWVRKLNNDSSLEFISISEKYGYSYRPLIQYIFQLTQRFYWIIKKMFTIILGWLICRTLITISSTLWMEDFYEIK